MIFVSVSAAICVSHSFYILNYRVGVANGTGAPQFKLYCRLYCNETRRVQVKLHLSSKILQVLLSELICLTWLYTAFWTPPLPVCLAQSL